MPILYEELPTIATQNELRQFLGISEWALRSIQRDASRFYRSFEIPKRRGGKRRITTPKPLLHEAQSRVATDILRRVVVHPAAHGFVAGRSIVTNAKMHLSGRHFLHLDLQDFFGTIRVDAVRSAFAFLGYEGDVAGSLGGLCCADGCLPQGAPTSPGLSNICAAELDVALAALAVRLNLTYTRYADDLTFSGDSIGVDLIDIFTKAIERRGFRVNTEKTLLSRNGGKNLVTGISVSRGRLCVPRSFKRSTRMAAHYLLKNGFVSESRNDGVFDPLYVDRVLGRLSYWQQIEPANPFPAKLKMQIVEQLGVLAAKFQ